MEKYSKAVSEMYSQFKPNPMEKYIGRHVVHRGLAMEVVGYTVYFDDSFGLIVDASQIEGWTTVGPCDVIIKRRKSYLYACISELID